MLFIRVNCFLIAARIQIYYASEGYNTCGGNLTWLYTPKCDHKAIIMPSLPVHASRLLRRRVFLPCIGESISPHHGDSRAVGEIYMDRVSMWWPCNDIIWICVGVYLGCVFVLHAVVCRSALHVVRSFYPRGAGRGICDACCRSAIVLKRVP